MDPRRFDSLVKSFSGSSTRRRIVRLLAALPLGVGLPPVLSDGPEAAGKDNDRGSSHRRHRRKAKHRHQSGQNKENRKGKRKGKGKGKDHGTTTASTDCAKRTCQPGSCGSQPDGCGGTMQCGCGANQLCVAGACQTCTVSCPSGEPIACGTALKTALAAGGTVYACPGTYAVNFPIATKDVTLIGAGAGATILDGSHDIGSVLTIGLERTVTLRDLTISNGSSSDSGAGIYNRGTLTLVGVSVTKNTASQGGGIYNYPTGTLTLEAGSSVSENTATFDGGGIYNNGTVTLEAGSSVSGNTASFGGGIVNIAGTVTLEASNLVCGNTLDDNCVGTPSGTSPDPTFPADCCLP
jgi:predicted outer membrane repeat protein